MNSKLLLTSAAVWNGALGLLFTFAPTESLIFLQGTAPVLTTVVLQLLGGALFGMAMLLWMSRDQTVGGIFGRPLVIAGLSYHTIAALALLRHVFHQPDMWMVLFTLVYGALALLFGQLMIRQPGAAEPRK